MSQIKTGVFRDDGRTYVRCSCCNAKIDHLELISSASSESNCPRCGSPWTGNETRSTIVMVTTPQGITGGAG